MFNAKEAQKLTQESIEKQLEERLSDQIQKACSEGKDELTASLSDKEIAILKKAGYKVTEIAFNSYTVSW